MEFLEYPVRYLQRSDFDDEGNIINQEILSSGKNTVIMMQAEFCGWCTKAKPAYQEFGNQYADQMFVTTTQSDGDIEGEKELGTILKKIDPKFRGFPSYVLYGADGKYLKTHSGNRTKDDIYNFCFKNVSM